MLVISMIAVTGSKHEIINESIVGVRLLMKLSAEQENTQYHHGSAPCIDNRQPFAHVVGRHWTAVVFTYNTRDR